MENGRLRPCMIDLGRYLTFLMIKFNQPTEFDTYTKLMNLYNEHQTFC